MPPRLAFSHSQAPIYFSLVETQRGHSWNCGDHSDPNLCDLTCVPKEWTPTGPPAGVHMVCLHSIPLLPGTGPHPDTDVWTPSPHPHLGSAVDTASKTRVATRVVASKKLLNGSQDQMAQE